MAKLVIDNEFIAEEYFSDTKLLGIQTILEPHMLAWQLNSRLIYDFRYLPGTEIWITKKGRKIRYEIYQYHETALQLSHFIYNNKSDGEYLMPELKHFDYLWLLKGESLPPDWLQLLQTEIKKINQVQVVLELSSSKLKNKTRLVL